MSNGVIIVAMICITLIACLGIICFSPISKNANTEKDENEKEDD